MADTLLPEKAIVLYKFGIPVQKVWSPHITGIPVQYSLLPGHRMGNISLLPVKVRLCRSGMSTQTKRYRHTMDILVQFTQWPGLPTAHISPLLDKIKQYKSGRSALQLLRKVKSNGYKKAIPTPKPNATKKHWRPLSRLFALILPMHAATSTQAKLSTTLDDTKRPSLLTSRLSALTPT